MVVTIDEVAEFESSNQHLLKWPLNLVGKDLYRPLLLSAYQRFDVVEQQLFTAGATTIIYFRDYDQITRKFTKHKVCPDPEALLDREPDEKLQEYLEGGINNGPRNTKSSFGRLDPHCRFVFLISGHSRTNLLVTRRMFTRLMTYHQVSYEFVDYICVFGSGEQPRDLRFGGFSAHTRLNHHDRCRSLPPVGRSGRDYQVCFNLKAPHEKHYDDGNRQWSVRQAAVYHKFDVENGRALWIMIKGNDELKRRVESVTGIDGMSEDKTYSSLLSCFRSSLGVLLMLALWSTEEWRRYIGTFEDEFERKTREAIHGDMNATLSRHVYQPKDLQSIQYLQEKMKEAVIVMRLNIEVLSSIAKFYQSLVDELDTPLSDHDYQHHVFLLIKQLDKMIHSLQLHVSRANLLVDVIADRKALIVQHMQTQTTEIMGRLALWAGSDAMAMRIITFVTLFYLPATFVSTFFSTDVVKYGSSDGGGPGDVDASSTSFSLVALERWLEVTLPLTVVTVVVAGYFYKRSMRRRQLGVVWKLPI